MKAVVWHGVGDIRLDEVPEPTQGAGDAGPARGGRGPRDPHGRQRRLRAEPALPEGGAPDANNRGGNRCE